MLKMENGVDTFRVWVPKPTDWQPPNEEESEEDSMSTSCMENKSHGLVSNELER